MQDAVQLSVPLEHFAHLAVNRIGICHIQDPIVNDRAAVAQHFELPLRRLARG